MSKIHILKNTETEAVKIFYNLFNFEFLYYKFMVFFVFLYILLLLI